ncbi:MAG: mechanosensitive ion channel [Muribaculaceae bacterium]|nr:mechanosensitive ion channel [Muribaculaceae bacterium]
MTPISLIDTTQPTDTVAATKHTFADLANLDWPNVVQQLTSSAIDFVLKLVVAAIVFYAGKLIVRKLHRLISRLLEAREAEPSLRTFILSLAKIVMMFVLIIVVIGILGIETSSFLALFASAGVAIGMALSGTLQNFAGGVLILLLKPYKVGDFIEAQGYAGTVREIQIFHTIISTGDNKSILIPNGPLSTGSINNASREMTRRVDWTVSISYGDDVQKARQAILNILNSDERVIKTESLAPVVFLGKLNDSSIDLTVRAWTESANYWGVFHDTNERIYNELPTHGINFPYPHVEVVMSKEA